MPTPDHEIIVNGKRVHLPSVPNFLIGAPGVSVSVADMSEEDLRRVGADWVEALLDHWRALRRIRSNERNTE